MRMSIVNYLSEGAENAVSMAELSRLLNISPRAVRRAVEHERTRGELILSNNNGYYLPSQDSTQARSELSEYCHRADARLRTNRACVRSARRRLKELERADSAQITIEDLTE